MRARTILPWYVVFGLLVLVTAARAAEPAAGAAVPSGAVCQAASVLAATPAPEPLFNDVCSSTCSDTQCAGLTLHAVCGSGLRCIPDRPCTVSGEYGCTCLPIS